MNRNEPIKYNNKTLQLQWVNTLVHVHDLHCGCNSPLEHTTLAITTQEPNLRFTDQEKKKLKKCLFGEEDTPVVDDIGEEDLSALFTEELGEPKDGEDTAG